MQQCPEFWILVASTVEQFSFLSTLSHTKVVQPPVSAMIYESKPTNHIWPWFLMNMAKDDFLPWDGFRSTSLFCGSKSICFWLYLHIHPYDSPRYLFQVILPNKHLYPWFYSPMDIISIIPFLFQIQLRPVPILSLVLYPLFDKSRIISMRDAPISITLGHCIYHQPQETYSCKPNERS